MDGRARMRVGLGTDRHRLEAGRALILGGIELPSPVGAVAHSDGDALLHAITDALLGSLALGDIGALFPDTDPQWKGSPSRVFVAEALRRVHAAGYALANVDTTIHLERVKIAPHRDAIRTSVAEILGCGIDRVGVKAKTGERSGTVGRGEVVDCMAVVLVEDARI